MVDSFDVICLDPDFNVKFDFSKVLLKRRTELK